MRNFIFMLPFALLSLGTVQEQVEDIHFTAGEETRNPLKQKSSE